jgi:hypothetical protein
MSDFSMPPDRDSRFTGMSDAILKGQGIEVHPLPICSPNLNAYAERFAQTLQVECLDHFIVIGEKHLNYLIREFTHYCHLHPPHQGRDNALLTPATSVHKRSPGARSEPDAVLVKPAHNSSGENSCTKVQNVVADSTVRFSTAATSR